MGISVYFTAERGVGANGKSGHQYPPGLLPEDFTLPRGHQIFRLPVFPV